MRPWSDLRAYYASEVWRRKRLECFKARNWCCGVCRRDWQARGDILQCHHYHYRTIGHEDIWRDLVPLCIRHHPKGRLTKEGVRQWRVSYLCVKLTFWLLTLPIRGLKLAWRSSWGRAS